MHSLYEHDEAVMKTVFCRKEFLKVINKAWTGSAVDFSLARQMASGDDIMANCAVAFATGKIAPFAELDPVGIPFSGSNDELNALITLASLPQGVEKEGFDYLFGNSDHVPSFNPVGEQYDVLYKDGFLFIGIEPGFARSVENKEAERHFILNCLEVCRKTSPSPTLLASPLYRRFIFINVNV